MNYLLTGESGFLGSIITRRLVQNNNVIMFLSSEMGKRVDISMPFELNFSLPIETVIHIAGKAHSIPKTKLEKGAFFHVNLNGTKNLCAALQQSDNLPQVFIFISTVAVYGIEKGVLIEENTPLLGETPYAKSKILAEEYLQDWANEKNVKLFILRLPLIAGVNAPGNLGAMIRNIKSGKYLSIGKANTKKSIVWGDDIATFLSLLRDDKPGGTYNLTDGYHPSFKDLERAIATCLDKKKIKTIPLFVARFAALLGDVIGQNFPINTDKLKKITSSLTFCDKKAREILGWKSSFVIDKIKDIV